MHNRQATFSTMCAYINVDYKAFVIDFPSWGEAGKYVGEVGTLQQTQASPWALVILDVKQ